MMHTMYMFNRGEEGPEILAAFKAGETPGTFQQRGPAPVEVAAQRVDKSAEEWSQLVKAHVLGEGIDDVGIAAVREEWVYEGYAIKERYVILLAVAHDYDEMKHAPLLPDDIRACKEVGRQYTRAAAGSASLLNFIRSNGFEATDYPGPMANALLMIPAAIEAGLGELGKHGSLIHPKLGSSFRLSAVTTDMPLAVDRPNIFGADDFCTNCQVCTNACPPAAISDSKQMVRGVEKWYVDFDACIPYFAEARGCGICIAVCPWSRPGVADNLLVKMARRRGPAPV